MTQTEPLPEDLAALKAKIAAQEAESLQGLQPGADRGANFAPEAMRGGRAALEMALGLILGVGAGLWLDKEFETTPLLALCLGFAGFLGGVMNAWKLINGRYGKTGKVEK